MSIYFRCPFYLVIFFDGWERGRGEGFRGSPLSGPFAPGTPDRGHRDTRAACLHTGEAVDVCARRPGERRVQHERRPRGRRGAVVGHIGRQGDVTGRRRGGERARGRPVAHGADAGRVRAGCGRIAGARHRHGKVSVLEHHDCMTDCPSWAGLRRARARCSKVLFFFFTIESLTTKNISRKSKKRTNPIKSKCFLVLKRLWGGYNNRVSSNTRGKRRVFFSRSAHRLRKTIYPVTCTGTLKTVPTIPVEPVPVKRAPLAFQRRIRCKYIFAFKETGRQRQNFGNLEILGEKQRRGVGHSLHGIRCAVLPNAVAHRHGSALFRVRQVSVRRAPCYLNSIYLHLFHTWFAR